MKSMVAAGSAPVLFNGCATGFLACRKINIGVVGFGVPFGIQVNK